MADLFCCKCCNKKFKKEDYKKWKTLESLVYLPIELKSIAHLSKRDDYIHTKWYNHLILPDVKPIYNDQHKCWKTPLKPWDYMCPKSQCIICLVKTGESPNFKDRNQFNYHRKNICKFKNVDYKQFIQNKCYSRDTTLLEALNAIESDPEQEQESEQEPEPEPEPEPKIEPFFLDKTKKQQDIIRLEAMERAKGYKKCKSEIKIDNKISNY